MTSQLVTRLLEQEGLTPLLALREAGEVPRGDEVEQLLAGAEILALGAAAQHAARRECGDEARIFVPHAPLADEGTMVVSSGETAGGTAFLRRIARARLMGPIGTRIVVDFGALGLEIAQVALSFGATDLAGPIASRRGLPLVGAETQKSQVKRRELAAYVERAGKKPIFVATDAPEKLATKAQSVTPERSHVDS